MGLKRIFEGKVMGIPKKSEEELLEEAQLKKDVLGGYSAALQPINMNSKIMGGNQMSKTEENLPSLGGAGDYQERLDGLLHTSGGKGKSSKNITSDILGGMKNKASSLLGPESLDANSTNKVETMLGISSTPKGTKNKKSKKHFDPTDNILGTFNSNLKVGQFANVNNMFGNSKPGKVNTHKKMKEFINMAPTKTKTKEANPFRNGYHTPVNVSVMLGLGAGGTTTGKVKDVLGKAMSGSNPVEKILGNTKTPKKGNAMFGNQFDINKILGAGKGKAPIVNTGLNPQEQINKILGQGPVKSGKHSQSVNVNKFLPKFGPQVGIDKGKTLGKEWRTPDFRNPANVGFERAQQEIGLTMFGDYDGDGLANAIDCDPRDKTEQGFFEKTGNFLGGRGFKEDSVIGKEAANIAAQGAIPQGPALAGVQRKDGSVGLRNDNNPLGLKKVRGGVNWSGNKLPAYGVTRGRPKNGVTVSDVSVPDTEATVKAIQDPKTGEVVILDKNGNPVSDQTFDLAEIPNGLDSLKSGVVAAGKKIGAGLSSVGGKLATAANRYIGQPIVEAADTQLERGRLGRETKLSKSLSELQKAEYQVLVNKGLAEGEKPQGMDAETWHMMQRKALTGYASAGEAQAATTYQGKLALDKQQAKERFKLERMKARSNVEIADAQAEARAGAGAGTLWGKGTSKLGKATAQLKNSVSSAAGNFGGVASNPNSNAVQAGKAMSAAMGVGNGMSLGERPMSSITGFQGGIGQAEATSYNLKNMSSIGNVAVNDWKMNQAAALGHGGGLSGGISQMSQLGGSLAKGDFAYRVAESLGESASKSIGENPNNRQVEPAPQPVQQVASTPAPQPVQQVASTPAPQLQAPPMPVTAETMPGNGISKSAQRLRQEYMAARPDKPPLPDGRVWSPRSRKYVKYPRGEYKDNDPTR